ncbi:MAG: radical SAM family heme chaperone HemW [Bacteroidota bacterium]
MAGIYIHVPFCRQACHYCDFHFSTNLQLLNEMVEAINKELSSRSSYLKDEVQTIYFGGGTPSLLSADLIQSILDKMFDLFDISNEVEITLEANPEDLSESYAKNIKNVGINRLSIGVQTFDDDRLKWMNRAHSSGQSKIAIQHARNAGFDNISLDLIYAIPGHDRGVWNEELEKICSMNPEHISLYGLTIEEKTVFGKWAKENKLDQVSEGNAADQYLHAIEYLKKAGYNQYEVSNFGKNGYHSRHNSAYWRGIPYLGIGPGAHSFNGLSRRFNMRNNAKYIRAIENDSLYYEEELLSATQLVNEKILTQLRTTQGLNLSEIDEGLDVIFEEMHAELLKSLQNHGLIMRSNGFLRLTSKGFLIADDLALKLFFQE